VTPKARVWIGLALIAAAIAGCGRRETPAWFDAERPRPGSLVAAGEPLPPSALKIRWGRSSVSPAVGANTSVAVRVTFTNAGDKPWPDVAAASPRLKDGSYAVRLTHRWIRAGDPLGDRLGAQRSDLPRSVMPGDSIEMPLVVHAPAEAGDYTLVIELVQELVQWFADRGADRLMLPVRVVPAAAAPAGTPAARSGQPSTAPDRR